MDRDRRRARPVAVCVERVDDADLTGAVEPVETAYWRVLLVAEGALPVDGDPGEAAGVLADSIVGHGADACDIGYAPSEPDSAKNHGWPTHR